MNKMIERVAAVIAAELMELTADQRRTFQFPEDANGDTCDRARSAARLAIEAMREPTEDMIEQGFIRPPQWDHDSATVLDVWQAMVDEALK